jgi:hypothetical protein
MRELHPVLVGVLGFALCGCGGGGSSSTTPPTPQGATMQTGQWEFTIASTNGNPNTYVEADLTSTPVGAIGSYVTATVLFQTGGGTIGGLYNECVSFQTTFSVSGNTVTALLFQGSNQIAQATATLAADGKSMTGTTQWPSGIPGTGLCAGTPGPTSGTFTGQVIAPLNGTYKGSLSDGSQLTLQVTQDSGFDITATGTWVAQGVTTNLTSKPNSGSPADNNVIGAIVSTGGTTSNINRNSTFSVFGYFNPAGTQIQIIFGVGSGGGGTGTLTKQ